MIHVQGYDHSANQPTARLGFSHQRQREHAPDSILYPLSTVFGRDEYPDVKQSSNLKAFSFSFDQDNQLEDQLKLGLGAYNAKQPVPSLQYLQRDAGVLVGRQCFSRTGIYFKAID